MRFRAMIGLIVGQKTLHPPHAAAEKTPDRMGAQVGERIVNENVDRARDDVVGGRAEVALFANDLAFAVTVENGGAFGPILELGARDFF